MAIDATSQARVIKAAALDAFKRAFDSYPVTVGEGRSGTGDNRANVEDGYNYTDCGTTGGNARHDSTVWYVRNMEMAQWALPITIMTAPQLQQALLRVDLMKAIGTGIGNNAAHEIAHQFFKDKIAAALDDNSSNTYNGAECFGDKAPWVYGIGSIRWGDTTANQWKKVLSGGWHK